MIYDKKQRALEVIQRLKDEYPDAGCTLDYDQAWKLLVSVRLAAQCTDARVNVVVEDLYAKYPDVEALAKAEPEEIEAIVKPCGLGKSKARDISACMRILMNSMRIIFPQLSKTAEASGGGKKKCKSDHGRCIWKACHCNRYALHPPDQQNRTGRQYQRAEKSGNGLWKIIPPEEGSDFCHRLVYHGRDVCTARTKPHCDKCCLEDICKKNI